ncbi:MAG: preprotein translocase subunit SecA [Parcubacteria group bacterium RIFCSPLOWO2_01_FULL_40_65]|nr:MAG: preprotein translocase subunit SecA [Parcubacteria group bacterium RIFCSPHIGHO2_01_FULL_40_30]OHB19332.1 MAG: preprotein translocase subunit SecA [Parcubacteria group bacterium RIFCSPHIGHO2_02_FULL_40_12]OHB21219.1 MAG: preprotein translocase subunit SecA [Parcubacteria group bacterium RIFCSPLOWO2_01_FULL_40_65]OHB22948.1 MAG: preprotein translocase subunit SecA [Parcubacteria group bacterium RIFCSPLOWO2_02_FULL_40_12]
MSFFSGLFGDANQRYINKVQPLVEKINSLEKGFERFSDRELKGKTDEFKKRFEKGESLDDLLPESFAAIREAAKRTLNQRHFNVQLIGGIVLHQGKIAEMKTGEGKTLTSTLAVYLNALSGQGVHVITVNDYLSRRDTVWMGQIYNALGLTVGCINHDSSFIYDPTHVEKDHLRDIEGSFKVFHEFLRPVTRREAYEADITYGTNNEFGFDYLRDNMAYELRQMSQAKGHNFAIVDEVDSILIDEARTPLIISAPDTESGELYKIFARVVPNFREGEDYNVDEKLKAVTITDAGIDKVEKMLNLQNIYDHAGMRYVHHLEQALRAYVLFKKDRDYVVKNGEIIIVDEFTGRLMPGRRWSEGLHQAVEAKEGVKIEKESKTLATITFQNYFRMYKKLAGMTGTAATSSEEFHKVYNLDVIIVPTNKPMIRENLTDRIYKTVNAKWKAVVEEIKERHFKGQPVLVGTVSIEKNELLSAMLKREGIPHNVLNAKNHESEGQMHAQAGKLGQVTVATNMAGRGVDILLGGNPPSPESAEKVKELGGLHVIGTERHEARRIDNQLRGRSGRQGDPGSSQFFISLDDDVIRIFGGERIKNMMETFGFPEDQPLEHGLVSRAIEQAQTKIEGHHFDARRYVLEFDNVMNKHRETIYNLRREALLSDSLKEKILGYFNEFYQEENTTERYEEKEKEAGFENMRKLERFVLLRVIDELWVDHLEAMDYLRNSVNLRAYGQRDPLVEYRIEGQGMFEQLLKSIKYQVVNMIFKVGIAPSVSQPQPVAVKNSQEKEIGRNDPCWCGSGKKYKKCHGK